MVWADNDYGYKMKITIDKDKVAGDESNFPVLVSVTKAVLKDTSNGGHVESSSGYDIVFYNANEDTLLDHEIERYVNTSGLIVFWVRIPSLSSTTDTDIYIYYGKSGVSSDPSTTAVWNSDFIAVYHMDESSGSADDSTSNGNDGTYAGSLPDQVSTSSTIGFGQDFDRTQDDYLGLPSGVDTGADYTAEIWVNDTDNLAEHIYFYYWKDVNNRMFLTATSDQNNYMTYAIYSSTTQWSTRGTTVVTGTQVYMVVSWEANNMDVQKDTTEILTDTSNTFGSLADSTTYQVGNRPALGAGMLGTMDEVRLSSIKRGKNWLDTTHATISAPDTFMSFDSEESRPVTAVASKKRLAVYGLHPARTIRVGGPGA